MEHAWLDSLSEDWPSQPGSDASVPQLPPLKNTETTKTQPQDAPSRIPRRSFAANSTLPGSGDNSINVLSERSASDINVNMQRQPLSPSKLSQEIKVAPNKTTSRSVSAASAGSVVHNTVHHETSPARAHGETPEWKRRLVYGDVQYGEQRDLFCSAAVGLQDMFRPPSPADEDVDQHETTMPSSPPVYHRASSIDLEKEVDAMEEEEYEYPPDVTPSPSPRRPDRELKYRLNVDDEDPASSPLGGFGNRQGDEIYRDESCLSASQQEDTSYRKVSGQSDTKNEDFSPIFIGKHSDEDGKVDFAPIEVPADQLRQKLERLRINQMLLDSQLDPQAGFDASNENISFDIENTEDYAQHGGFLNFHRGGRSGEGSFRYRGLSPGLGGDTSEMLPEESLQASTPKQFPTIRTEGTNPWATATSLPSPSMPRAPFPSPEKRQARGSASGQSGGSPLKLFGPYDTFTNQTLLRRISQFEEGMSGSTSKQSLDSIVEGEPSPVPADKAFMASSPSKGQQMRRDESYASSRSVSQFGAGHLEGFQFNGDISHLSSDESGFAGDKENMSPQGPSWPTAVADGRHTRGSSPDEESELMIRRRRNKSSASSAGKHGRVGSISSQLRMSINPAMGSEAAVGTPKRDSGSEGKRPRTSPSKDPTPKRRRTLHRSDIAYGREEQASVLDAAHQLIHSVMGKKRKDARPGGFELADPEVLAMRDILRPRTPTPTRKSSYKHGQHSNPDLEPAGSPRPRKSPVRALQNENVGQSSDAPSETERKPSIRTQDFVDQAAQIMAMIRSQVRAPGLASLEESEAEHGSSMDAPQEESYQESTNEPFSRPPSRELKSIPKHPQRQEDPELANRLKKYQELSDMGDVISSSMRSVGLAKDAIRAAQEVERQINENSRARADAPFVADGDVISDLANVRISTNPVRETELGNTDREFLSNSSGHSTNRTYPTSSSRGSDSRRVIMPETVSHLIPDKVGSMYLDKQKNIWIKKKDAMSPPRSLNESSFEDSEDDPFASIPDLSVDLTREMQNLRIATAQKQKATSSPSQLKSPKSPSRETGTQPRGYVTLSPNGHLSPEMGTVAREEFEKLEILGELSPKSANGEEAEGEAGDHEDKSSDRTSTRRRNLTISFSSPIASIIQDVAAEDLDSMEDDPTPEEPDDFSPTHHNRSPDERPAKSGLKKATQGSQRGNRSASRHLSVRNPAFVPRPVSRIDEQDEDSTVEIGPDDDRQLSIIGETSLVGHKTPGGRRTSLSFLVNRTPGTGALSVAGEDSAVIGQNVGKLSLSPLSEFTLNNSDQSFGFEVSYVMGRRHMATGDGSKRVMSMTIRALVDKLSEVEPFEPYWEDIAELDLHDKQLSSLHMLDEFCGKVITLDASKNTLAHLDGVPTSVRQLKVSQNMLTELTSWDHLMNLQYVDISGNELKSLSALKGLVHLRSIKADDNQLTSLDGLDCHDGLLSLRARNNLIQEVDFAAVTLERLTDLDLSGNMISRVENLELAPALARLKLSQNRLQTLELEVCIKTLRQLDVSDNELMSLDIGNLPSLHSLYADRNSISQLSGFNRARHLDSLSLREQRGKDPLDLGFLSTAYEIRKLFLSGNYLGTFAPSVDFLNLQLLELANCGLRSLPENLGQLMPNLRTLNLNFNAVSDLSPLQFVPRMKKLLVAGNRLKDSTMVTELLTEFPHLRQLDLRDNPVTLGFYAPVQVLVPTDRTGYVDPFVLPDVDVKRDELFSSRLDQATRLRRRLHQIVFVASCKRLRSLDGLPVSRQEVLAKDSLLDMLVAEGLLPDIEATFISNATAKESASEVESHENKTTETGSQRSSRKNAGDSSA